VLNFNQFKSFEAYSLKLLRPKETLYGGFSISTERTLPVGGFAKKKPEKGSK
jgi:hypothetical protein